MQRSANIEQMAMSKPMILSYKFNLLAHTISSKVKVDFKW